MPASPCIDLDTAARARLLEVARRSIEHGLGHAMPLPVDAAREGEALARPAAVFVTLTRHGDLRGCIGSLEAREALAPAVARAAYNAAFTDRRFPPLEVAELGEIDIEISVLSPLEPLAVASRAQLIARLRPGADGLLIEDRGLRSTFLPQVWEKIADPDAFVGQLLQKAGLPADHWSPTLRARRYATLSFHEDGPT